MSVISKASVLPPTNIVTMRPSCAFRFRIRLIVASLCHRQSDIVHQSVYELVHSEDRQELQRQLMWNSHLPSDKSNISIHDAIQPGIPSSTIAKSLYKVSIDNLIIPSCLENCHLLERSFTVRFRCLLDNTSGFLVSCCVLPAAVQIWTKMLMCVCARQRLDIRGRIKVLHGQNKKTEELPLALFAVCSPFGPPSLLDMPQKDVMFKSKHKLDLSLVSMDQRLVPLPN